MLEEGVIQESRSPWNSPLFLVPKKDGTLRPVIDFRHASAVTLDEHYLSTVLNDLLMSLGRENSIFSSLDLPSGYWQMELEPASQEITAFSTPSGCCQWPRMSFGSKSAPLTFQKMMNYLFEGLLGNSVFVYLDDLSIASRDPETHLKNLEAVLYRLQETGSKVKLSKCELFKSKI